MLKQCHCHGFLSSRRLRQPLQQRVAFVRTEPKLPFALAASRSCSSFSGSASTKSLGRRTFYDILEVTPKAKKDEIKEAYRRLAKRYHPDRNIDDTEAEARFKEVQEAHATLSDSWKRALYDQDLQFSKFGTGAEQEVTVEKWTEHWSKETPEEREARKERYRRYAAGERNDIPPDAFAGKFIAPGMLITVGVVFYICVKAPDWLDAQNAPHYCDPMHDDTSVPLVRAFHNPVLDRWERLPEGMEAPKPQDLYAFYKKVKPEVFEYIDVKLLPKVSLTVLQVPRTDAVMGTYSFAKP